MAEGKISFDIQTFGDDHWTSQELRPSQDAAKAVADKLFAAPDCLGVRIVQETIGADGHAVHVVVSSEIREVAEIAIRGCWPDLTIILDIPADKSMDRLQRAKDRIEQRPMEYHAQVHRNYLAQAAGNPRYCVISADREREVVHAAIIESVATLLQPDRGVVGVLLVPDLAELHVELDYLEGHASAQASPLWERGACRRHYPS